MGFLIETHSAKLLLWQLHVRRHGNIIFIDYLCVFLYFHLLLRLQCDCGHLHKAAGSTSVSFFMLRCFLLPSYRAVGVRLRALSYPHQATTSKDAANNNWITLHGKASAEVFIEMRFRYMRNAYQSVGNQISRGDRR